MYSLISIKEGRDEVAYPAMVELFNELCFSSNLPCFCDGNSNFIVVGLSEEEVLAEMTDSQRELLDVWDYDNDLYVGNMPWK